MTRNQAIAALKAKIENTRTLQVVAVPALQARQMFLQVGRNRYQVASIAEAVEMHNTARDHAEHGVSGMPRVTIVDADGMHLYGISYNGRVWDGDRPLDGETDEQRVACAQKIA